MICRSRDFTLLQYMFALTGHNQLQQGSGEAWTKMSTLRRLWKRNRCGIILMLGKWHMRYVQQWECS